MEVPNGGGEGCARRSVQPCDLTVVVMALGKENFMLSIRQVVQDYGRSCERLLSSQSFDTPLSDEEARFIQYLCE